ncbi:glycoside hydrolase superfamily [Gongronella butleri]|nr:glycoside hydrolase superfamily [Gongronella butleri]
MKASLTFLLTILGLAWQAHARPLMTKRASSSWDYWSQKAWGANLGNWLILERWMDTSTFDAGNSDAQDEWTFSSQVSNAADLLQQHWDSWITADDFSTLASANVNHVRVPVGFWAFITPDDGEPYISNGGQKKAMERILGYCAQHGIYALIDLHGLPGSQNGEAHSGHIGSIDFYSDHNIQRGLQTVQAAVDWINGLDPSLQKMIAGLEVANEPHANSDSDKTTLRSFYTQAYDIVNNASNFKVPMVFHDAFLGVGYWSDFLPAPANAVIDLHPYWAYSDYGSSGTILSDVCNYKTQTFHLPVLFGEWSLASNPGMSSTTLQRQFMDSQVDAFQSAGGAGAIFWALKNAINSDAWSFEQLVNDGIINSGTFSQHNNSQC